MILDQETPARQKIATVACRRVKCFRLSQHGYDGPITADRDSSANKLAVDFIAGETALPYQPRLAI